MFKPDFLSFHTVDIWTRPMNSTSRSANHSLEPQTMHIFTCGKDLCAHDPPPSHSCSIPWALVLVCGITLHTQEPSLALTSPSIPYPGTLSPSFTQLHPRPQALSQDPHSGHIFSLLQLSPNCLSLLVIPTSNPFSSLKTNCLCIP